MAFVRRGSAPESSLIVANADGSGEQTLATRKIPELFIGPLAWSPDGKIIACVTARGIANLIAVSVDGGAEKPMSAHRWNVIPSVAWLADGSGVIVTASDRSLGPNSQIWQISYPGGEERRITNDLNDYQRVSLTADSSALLTMQENMSVSLWVGPEGETNRAAQITSRTGKDDGRSGVAWTPDGRIVYTSTASGNLDLWMMNADGSNQKQLTMNAGRNLQPAVSPDGRYLVFMSDRAGGRESREIWRMNLDGSNPKQLVVNGGYPQFSSDGNWVITEHGGSGLRKVTVDGGTPVQLTDQPSFYLAVSPEGKLVGCFYGSASGKIAVIPIEGGPAIKTFDTPPTAASLSRPGGLRWTPDGRALTYVITVGSVSNIWSQSIDGGPPKQLTDFKAEQIFAFDWSRDGRLVISRGVANRDVVLISNFR